MNSAVPPNLLEVEPKVRPPLDPDFRPISLGNRAYAQAAAQNADAQPWAVVLEHSAGQRSVFTTQVLPQHSDLAATTLTYAERLTKFLLWQIGGCKMTIAGPAEITAHLRQVYSPQGKRAFDAQLMERVYQQPLSIEAAAFEDLPPALDSSVALGGHLEGCRIGFDLGASDYKLAAVKDGEAVFSTEIPWDPKHEADPEFHYQKINDGLKLAAKHLPRVDAIGGSSAGIYIDNQVRVASLFRAVPEELFATQVRPLFQRLQREWQVPMVVVNDGDVTALAGAMSLKAHGVLGVAMGSSEAAGYLNREGRITGWLNELAFAPVDYNPAAPVDEWSGDRGCGAQYFSQQAVGRLVEPANIPLDPGLPLPERLKAVQSLMQNGDERARRIYETIGVYLGYALAQYATMYGFQHLLILGRVTSGLGGEIILQQARHVLETEFPEEAEALSLHLPDEKSKRVGQAVAAASLPEIDTAARSTHS